jgi:hypothetical protein
MNEIEKANQIIKAIWIALVASPVIFFFAGYFVLFPEITEVKEEKFVYVFMGFALLQAILSKVFYIKADTCNGDEKKVIAHKLKHYLISWALGDSIAVIGLILPVICGKNSIQYAYSFFIAAVLLNYVHKPNLES